ncbi:glycoside hydrolase domain-containing protein [Bifidobacterium pullorum]|uniref:glycoside hydrolase domain-containing protein n=1 Tax=Bifidobacterium pullorum TaxID=78448 RepID=UPI0027BA26FB|nr:glycoside hydrolase domain-containing protein [Bifidobacterium pullorum]
MALADHLVQGGWAHAHGQRARHVTGGVRRPEQVLFLAHTPHSTARSNSCSTDCDTRFEITDERLATLKADGYQIVGRYLTEPNRESLDPKDYFKAIRPGELERITKGGMKFYPIFQEYSTKLEHFTPANGAAHAKAAREAAERLGIPPTHIYFAVDFDATDDQVTSTILPYFKSILANLGGGYKVGIYASRNICSRVINAGQAGVAFVSDMSTEFSGNPGFPIPDNWVYDQFTEISNYKNQGWDLDRVAYSGKMEAVSYVRQPSAGGSEINQGTDYTQMDAIDLIWHLEQRFDELRAQGKVGRDYIPNGTTGIWNTVPTWECMLKYLSKYYLRVGGNKSTLKWSMAVENFRSADAKVLEADTESAKIIEALDRYIGSWRQSMVDISNEEVDLAHMCVTTL